MNINCYIETYEGRLKSLPADQETFMHCAQIRCIS